MPIRTPFRRVKSIHLRKADVVGRAQLGDRFSVASHANDSVGVYDVEGLFIRGKRDAIGIDRPFRSSRCRVLGSCGEFVDATVICVGHEDIAIRMR